MNKLILVFLASVALTANAQLNTLDDGLNPVEKWIMGSHAQGAYSVYVPLFCSPTASQTYLAELIPENTELTPSGPTAKSMLEVLNPIINSVQGLLVLSGDRAATGRHICTGFYNEKQSHIGNALSKGTGYLVFDFKLFQHLYSLPDDERSSWVIDFVVLHEFSHQLQYWNEDEEVAKTFAGEQNSRIPELAADCMAGALLTMKNASLPDYIFDASFKGAVNAAFKLGDYNMEDASHHGTPIERFLATSAGRDFVKAHLKAYQTLGGLTSQVLLRQCNAAVKK